jgi:Family of unknown function (DUF6356)
MRNPFTAHPHSVGETYGQHLRFAFAYGFRMTLGGVMALVHSVFPFLFERNASAITDELKATLDRSRANRRQPLP